MQPKAWTFDDLLAGATTSAVHLEMRDVYYSNPRFEDWRNGARVDWDDRGSWWLPFHQDVADAVARGVKVRRARVISEPATEYILWEHYVTEGNLQAGEDVRWLTRELTADLLMPGRDFWIFDNQIIRLASFSGNGDFLGDEFTDDPALVGLNAAAFERVWERAIPHQDYKIK